MTIKHQLVTQLTEVLEQLGISDSTPSVDYPTDPKHGDYATNVALIAAKKLGKHPMEVAEDLKSKISDLKCIEKIEVATPGFINFWITNNALIESATVKNNLPDIGKGREVVVEYSSPNIAKPFTVGHLRSTIIGDAIASLLEATGWKVHRDNHVGDWGTQFGKQIYAMKEWGNEKEIEKSEKPVKPLVDLYIKFHEEAEKDPSLEDKAREWFKKLEDGDSEARELWQKCIDWSWKEFNAIYETLGVRFTENDGRGYGESFFENKMSPVIQELKEKGLLKEGENGARLVFFPDEKLSPLMILKKDGATLYSTRDLATDKFRLGQYGRDVLIINEVGAEQSFYFRQLYQLEEMLGWVKEGQRVHVRHGLFRFKEGKMSTRKGNVIWLEDVLENAEAKAFSIFSQKNIITEGEKIVRKSDSYITSDDEEIMLPEIVGIGAIKWNDLKRSPEQDIVFDWDELLNMQGNSGPYIQYTYARTRSVIARSEERATKQSQKGLPRSLQSLAMTIEERELLRLLSRFPEIVEEAAVRYAPNVLCTYLFAIAQAFNLFYQKCPILKAEEEVKDFRLALTDATGTILKNGLNLLGIQAPEKM